LKNNAEFMAVKENFFAAVPENLPLEYASTVTLGSIALK